MPCSQPAASVSGILEASAGDPGLREQLCDQIERVDLAQTRPPRPPVGLHGIAVVELPERLRIPLGGGQQLRISHHRLLAHNLPRIEPSTCIWHDAVTS